MGVHTRQEPPGGHQDFFYALNWKSTLSNRLLLDSSLTYNSTDIPQYPHTPKTCDCQAPAVGPDVISALDSGTGIMFRSASGLLNVEPYGNSNSRALRYISSLSYVTGAHAAKFGFRLMRGQEWFNWEINGARGYTVRAGVPESITQWATPIRWQNNVNADLGLFVQDQWTMKRLTVTGGLRYDYWDGGAEEMDLGAGPYVGARSFAGTEHSPRWKDLSPRLGVAYDLFGDSKTALKATAGRFITTTSSSGGFGAPFGSDSPNPVVLSILSVTRNWGDTNGNYIPDCDLANRFLNGECGQINNLNFGQNNPNALTISPDILGGNRLYNWDMSLVLQRQIMNGVSLSAGYYRKQFYNFTVTENTLFTPGDYKEYCVNAPSDPQDQTTLQADVDLVWIQPHMHYRGKDFILRAVYPSGETKTIVNVPRYSFAWQVGYELSEPVKLPKGTRLETVSHYDNSTGNKYNPDPTKTVRYGAQTTDEMNVSFVGVIMDAKADPAGIFSRPPRAPRAPE